jgi:hypothetical protein
VGSYNLTKLLATYIVRRVKIGKKIRKQIRRELAAAGGRARAAKYDKKTIAAWGRKGGRPPKK